MERGHMFCAPSYVWAYCEREAAAEKLRASDIMNQLFAAGIEVRESSKAEAARNREVVGKLRAIV
jgi:hypothetical protein